MLRRLPIVLLALSTQGCDEPLPTATTITINTNNTINGTPLPNATPSPSPVAPGAADKVIVGLTVTEIGGDGQRTFPVGESASLTATPRNRDGLDPCVGFPSLSACGAYTEADIRWFAGTGVVTDCTSATGVVCDLGPSGTNYNRRFRALRVGSFTYSAQFRDLSPVSFTGTVQ